MHISEMHNKQDTVATWVSKKLFAFVCFELLIERISFVCNRKPL